MTSHTQYRVSTAAAAWRSVVSAAGFSDTEGCPAFVVISHYRYDADNREIDHMVLSYFTPEEARALAQALTRAADDATRTVAITTSEAA
jgi:hypothetical protein